MYMYMYISKCILATYGPFPRGRHIYIHVHVCINYFMVMSTMYYCGMASPYGDEYN